MIATGEIWLQQPLHPTFSALQRLHQCLNLNYGDGSSTPIVPDTTPRKSDILELNKGVLFLFRIGRT